MANIGVIFTLVYYIVIYTVQGELVLKFVQQQLFVYRIEVCRKVCKYREVNVKLKCLSPRVASKQV